MSLEAGAALLARYAAWRRAGDFIFSPALFRSIP